MASSSKQQASNGLEHGGDGQQEKPEPQKGMVSKLKEAAVQSVKECGDFFDKTMDQEDNSEEKRKAEKLRKKLVKQGMDPKQVLNEAGQSRSTRQSVKKSSKKQADESDILPDIFSGPDAGCYQMGGKVFDSLGARRKDLEAVLDNAGPMKNSSAKPKKHKKEGGSVKPLSEMDPNDKCENYLNFPVKNPPNKIENTPVRRPNELNGAPANSSTPMAAPSAPPTDSQAVKKKKKKKSEKEVTPSLTSLAPSDMQLDEATGTRPRVETLAETSQRLNEKARQKESRKNAKPSRKTTSDLSEEDRNSIKTKCIQKDREMQSLPPKIPNHFDENAAHSSDRHRSTGERSAKEVEHDGVAISIDRMNVTPNIQRLSTTESEGSSESFNSDYDLTTGTESSSGSSTDVPIPPQVQTRRRRKEPVARVPARTEKTRSVLSRASTTVSKSQLDKERKRNQKMNQKMIDQMNSMRLAMETRAEESRQKELTHQLDMMKLHKRVEEQDLIKFHQPLTNDSRIAVALENNTSFIRQSLERSKLDKEEDDTDVRYKIEKEIKSEPPAPLYHPHMDLQGYFVDVIEPYLAQKQSYRRSEMILAVGYGFKNNPSMRERVTAILDLEFPAEIKFSLKRQVGYARVVAIMSLSSGGETVLRPKRTSETYLDHYSYIMSFLKMTSPLLSANSVAQKAMELIRNSDKLWSPVEASVFTAQWLSNFNSRLNSGKTGHMDKTDADKFVEGFSGVHSKTQCGTVDPAALKKSAGNLNAIAAAAVQGGRQEERPGAAPTGTRQRSDTYQKPAGTPAPTSFIKPLRDDQGRCIHPISGDFICTKHAFMGDVDGGLRHFMHECKVTFCIYCRQSSHNVDTCPSKQDRPGYQRKFVPKPEHGEQKRGNGSFGGMGNWDEMRKRAGNNHHPSCGLCGGKGKNGTCTDINTCEICSRCKTMGEPVATWLGHSDATHAAHVRAKTANGDTNLGNMSLNHSDVCLGALVMGEDSEGPCIPVTQMVGDTILVNNIELYHRSEKVGKGGKTYVLYSNGDKRYSHVWVCLPDVGSYVQVKIDTGCVSNVVDGVISSDVAEQLCLKGSEFESKTDGIITLADGSRTMARSEYTIAVQTGGITKELKFMELEELGSGMLLGNRGLLKLGITSELDNILGQKKEQLFEENGLEVGNEGDLDFHTGSKKSGPL